jgi:hypothetical protein
MGEPLRLVPTESSVSEGSSSTGWGGRTADQIADFNTTIFPPVTSTAGTPIFTTGNIERPLAIAAAPTRLDAALRLDGFPNAPDNDPRYLAMQNLLSVDQNITLVRGASRVTSEAVEMERALRSAGDPLVPTANPEEPEDKNQRQRNRADRFLQSLFLSVQA